MLLPITSNYTSKPYRVLPSVKQVFQLDYICPQQFSLDHRLIRFLITLTTDSLYSFSETTRYTGLVKLGASCVPFALMHGSVAVSSVSVAPLSDSPVPA